jgi:tetratricopeptide (TPR) repeat protein
MRWLHLPAALLAGIGLACTPAAESADAARAEVEHALTAGDRAGALRAVDALAAALPESADAELELARLRVRAGDAPGAAWALEAALRRHPARHDLRLALARIALLLGDPGEAQRHAAAIPLDAPEHADAQMTRAQAELQAGDSGRALERLAEVERRHPERSEAGFATIAALLSEGRTDEALAALERMQRRPAPGGDADPALRRALELTLAQLRAHSGDPEAAIAGLEALIEEDPSDLLPWQSLAPLLVAAERGEEATQRLAAAIDAEVLPPAALGLLAQVQAALGRDAAVRETLARYAAVSEVPSASVPLVEWHAARGEHDDALRSIERALERHAEDPTLLRLHAEALLAADRLEAARAAVRRHRDATFEGDPEIAYLSARLRLARGDATGAAQALRELAPELDAAPVQFWLGRALEQTGDLPGARRRYGLAHQRDPRWTPPLIALYRLESRRGSWPEAAQAAVQLVRNAPGSLAHWSLLADALEALGDLEGAEALARRAEALFPERVLPQLLLARALRAQGRSDESLAALDAASARAQGEASDDARIAAERVLALASAGRVPEAIETARGALERGESAPVQAALAAVRFQSGDADGGRLSTTRALALDPANPRPRRLLCQFEAARGALAAASEACDRYLALRPDDAGIHFVRGAVWAALGADEEAIAAYRRAAALDLRDARPRNNLALLLARRGDLDGALAAAQEAYRLAERDPRVVETLASLYRQRGLDDRAIALLESARVHSPEHVEVAIQLALAYRDSHREAQARALLAELRERAAGDPRLAVRVEEAFGAVP